MAIAIAKAERIGKDVRLEVCPEYDNGCGCEVFPDTLEDETPHPRAGELKESHPAFVFGPPPSKVDDAGKPVRDNDGLPVPSQTPDEWAQNCVREALLTVQAAQKPEPVTLDALHGTAL